MRNPNAFRCGDATNPGGPHMKDNGDPCTNYVIPGTFRCHLHGGRTPTAKYKAELAMAMLRLPAIEVLYTAMERLNEMILQSGLPTCAACGYPVKTTEELEATIKACISLVKTCQVILDRTGIGPTAKLEIHQSDGDLDLSLLTEDEAGRMIALLTQLEAEKAAVRQRMLGLAAPPASSTVQ